MSTLLTNVGTIINSLISWLGSVATGLINNPIFQIMLAVILFILLFRLMVGLAKSVRSKRDEKEIENMPYYKLDDNNYELYDDNDEPTNVEELWNLDYDEYDDYLDSLNGNNDNY